ncbi:MAG: NAD-dependent epimerase/dehydratase family protein, partial [Clostridiaceae bacterium]|nr:NAD-dependent epimerase/dehydratase family protein [Clostridiaceae bacterium]
AEVISCSIHDEEKVKELIAGKWFDTVANFVAFHPSDVERDIRLFADHCGQYIFISSASAYQKPLSSHIITESTPLANPYWQYSRDKIACEEILMQAYRDKGFPITIVRPSHTYGDWSVPLGVHGPNGSWSVVSRIMQGKPVIVHGDGSSLWTMTHNSDFARGFTGLMGNLHTIGEAVHITSDESLTWNQIYECIGMAVGVKPILHHVTSYDLARMQPELGESLLGDKAHSVVFDNSKLKRLVPGFYARVRFDQGVRRTIDYIKQHPGLQTADPGWDEWVDSITGG